MGPIPWADKKLFHWEAETPEGKWELEGGGGGGGGWEMLSRMFYNCTHFTCRRLSLLAKTSFWQFLDSSYQLPVKKNYTRS